jgi:hypothetical protein
MAKNSDYEILSKALRGILVLSLVLVPMSLLSAPIAQAFTLGCSKAQADAQDAGLATSLSIQAESRYVDSSKYTQAYQEYLAANKFANAWKKIIEKSPKCFKDQRPKIEPIFKKFYSKASTGPTFINRDLLVISSPSIRLWVQSHYCELEPCLT